MEGAAVERKREQHDVAGDGAGDGDSDEQRPVLAAFHVSRLDAVEGVGWVADGVEETGDGTQRSVSRVPDDRRQRAADIEPAFGNSRDDQRNLLDEPDAGRAMDPFKVELDADESPLHGPTVKLGERGVVEFLKTSALTEGRLFGSVDPSLERVVVLESCAVDDVIGHPAAGAAELQIGLVINQPRRYRQPAVGA